MFLECADCFFAGVAAMDVGWDKMVFFVFGNHELLQDIGAFVVEVVYLGFESSLFQEFMVFYIRGEQVWFCSIFFRLGEDCVRVVFVRD